MGLSQAANYVLPLVTLPYVTRMVGPSNYGLAEFASVSMLYFSALVTYGFIFTGTRKVAQLGERHQRISTVYSVVQQAKVLLLILSSILFIALILWVPQYQKELWLMLFAYPYVIGWALYPDFLFQGRQDLGVIATLNFAIKSTGALLIFILIKGPEDYYWIVGINSLTQVGASLLSLGYAHKRYAWLRFSWQPLRLVKAYLLSGAYMFASLFFTRIFVFGSILFLGFLLPAKELGIYAAALKLITVGQSFLFNPLGSSLYPHLAKELKESPQKYLRDRKRFQNYLIALSAFAALVTIIGREFIIDLLFGAPYREAGPLLAIMAPVFVFTALSHFTLKQGLMVLKADKENWRSVLITGLLSIAFNYFLIEWQGLYGAAWAKLGLEVILAALGIYYFRKVLARTDLAKV